ncbi:anti-sigma factor domain-containing protein [Falsibacillus albus]|uniref:Anti-sigma factor domain-containing protein n=1 Tax=Falsibacillus albus TaxID=2478915 RepID=A0A3L7K230_9BACI|nr:anti-sigma factor domain-containing protein [Falsibacillus albus]RLQ97116.1 anti-sigma factor domain-containing protein [Falsibacillus albus]
MMKKGIIMDIKEDYLVMLTADGEFLKGKKTSHDYELGDEISFRAYELKLEKKNPFVLPAYIGNKRALASIAAIFILSFVLLFPFFQENQVYAYVSIDINPSIELGVNKDFEVVETKAFNDDGKKILEHISLSKHQEMTNAAEKIMEESEKEGYLKENHQVVIASVPLKKSSSKFQSQMEKDLQSLNKVSENLKAQLIVLKATPKVRKAAVAQGLTTGKYLKGKETEPMKAMEKEKQPEKQKPQTNEDGTGTGTGHSGTDNNSKSGDSINREQNNVHPSKKKPDHPSGTSKPSDQNSYKDKLKGSEKDKNIYPKKGEEEGHKGYRGNHDKIHDQDDKEDWKDNQDQGSRHKDDGGWQPNSHQHDGDSDKNYGQEHKKESGD